MSDFSPLGDAAPGQILYAYFNTRDNTGAGSALSSGSVRAYKNGSTAESTAGLTLTTDFDGLTGLNLIAIDTSADGTFYAAGNDFAIVWAGTVNGIASTGNAAAAFSLSNRSVRDSSGVTTLLSRLSAARAGYLDNLSAGAVALESSLQALITTVGASAVGVATAVWGAASRTLTAFGFSVTASSVTDKTGYALTGAYDAAKTAAQAGDAMALTTGERTSTGTAVWSATTRILTAGTNLSIPSASDNATATAAAITSDHGSGSYIRNTEPPTAIQNRAEMDSNSTRLASIDSKTTNLPSDPADQSLIIAATNALTSAIAALNNVSASDVLTQINAALDATVADSIPADGARPSVRQAAYIGTQFLLERSVTGTSVSVMKPDGVTPLLTLTLSDADEPSSITRAA